MSLNDKALGYIRTLVPYGIGAVLAWLLATYGLNLTGDFQVTLVVFATTVVTNIYYYAVRLFEVKFPEFGVLLGFPKSPNYTSVDNLWASFVRTAIPTLVGGLLVILFVWIGGYFGFHLDADTQSGLIVTIVALVSSGYYALARAIVAKYPQAKILLGTDVAPTFPVVAPVVEAPAGTEVAAGTFGPGVVTPVVVAPVVVSTPVDADNTSTTVTAGDEVAQPVAPPAAPEPVVAETVHTNDDVSFPLYAVAGDDVITDPSDVTPVAIDLGHDTVADILPAAPDKPAAPVPTDTVTPVAVSGLGLPQEVPTTTTENEVGDHADTSKPADS